MTWFQYLLAFLLMGGFGIADGAEMKSLSDVSSLESMAVQSGGRIKPLRSFAQEAIIFVTGKERFKGWDSAALFFEWLARPDAWENEPLIPLSSKALRESLKTDAARVSPKFLSSQTSFIQMAEQADLRSEGGEVLTALEKSSLAVYQKMNLFYSSAEGKTWTVIPDPAHPENRWLSVHAIRSDDRFLPMAGLLNTLIQSYLAGQAGDFERSSREFLTALGTPHSFPLEIHYERLRPFRWAWRCYLLACLSLLMGILMGGGSGRFALRTGYGTALAGFIFHTYGFILRCLIAGRPPVSNMYESVVWVSWAVVFFSILLFIFYRSPYLGLASSGIATLGLILADGFPAVLDPSIAPLVPVLRNNFWLTVHVLTITLSYGAFALALGIGHVSAWMHAFQPEKENTLRNLTEFLYRAVQIGVVLLAAGTILGGVWANYSWGRFWAWDPKETWAFIALLGYLAILHSRFIGWLTPFGLAVGSVVAFLGILMAWYGVNFVLAAGLHSYGFGGGGFPYVTVAVLIDLLFIAGLTLVRRKKIPAASESH